MRLPANRRSIRKVSEKRSTSETARESGVTSQRDFQMIALQDIVLVDGAGAASQDGSIALVYLRPCDPGDRMLRWHPRQ